MSIVLVRSICQEKKNRKGTKWARAAKENSRSEGLILLAFCLQLLFKPLSAVIFKFPNDSKGKIMDHGVIDTGAVCAFCLWPAFYRQKCFRKHVLFRKRNVSQPWRSPSDRRMFLS